jgi:hypothetical protein
LAPERRDRRVGDRRRRRSPDGPLRHRPKHLHPQVRPERCRLQRVAALQNLVLTLLVPGAKPWSIYNKELVDTAKLIDR